MLPVLVSLKSLIKSKQCHIDYPLFRLHYQATVGVLLAFCLILTAKVMFGDTIDCMARSEARDPFSDNLCYSQGTFTHYNYEPEPDIKHQDQNLTQPQALALDSSPVAIPDESEEDSESSEITSTTAPKEFSQRYSHYLFTGIPIIETKHMRTDWHRYYQYMPVILFIQAVFFYFPHYLWKSWENGVISSICKQLNENRFNPADFIESNFHIVHYLQDCFHRNKSLISRYYFCHTLLLLNLVVQVVVMDVIFNYQFINYGCDVMRFWFTDQYLYGMRDWEGQLSADLNNPMNYVFPKVTGCTVRFLSAGGNQLNQKEYVCVLTLNILHDKFFLILWFWFVILFLITTAQFIYDIIYNLTPGLRRYMFNKKYGQYLSKENMRSTSLSELFLLDIIGSNSDKFAFSALLVRLNKEDMSSDRSKIQSLV